MPLDRPALATDDRARRVPTLRVSEVRAAAQGPDPHRAALARHLRNAINAESRRWTLRGWTLGLGLVVIWIGLMVVVVMSGLYRQPILGRVITWGGLIGIGIISRADTRRRVASQLAATAVAEGLCGSRCYSLHDLVPEPDGCLVCPECGAAWNTRRITRPHWLTAAAPRARAEGGKSQTAANWFVRFITLTPPSSRLLAPDDRGRFVSIVDSRLYLIPRARRAELGPERELKARRALRRIRRVPRVLLGMLPLGLAAISVYASISLYNGREPEFAPVMIVPFLICLLLGIGLLLSHTFYSPRLAAQVMVGQSLCASCARPLDNLPVDADGCAVCPECGASWRPPTIAP